MKGDFQVGEWLVQPLRIVIESRDKSVHLEPKAMDLLVYLARHQGEVIPKEQLVQAVWPDAFVTDEVLTNTIWKLRQAFGDNPKDPEFIQTVPRRGYQLIAPVNFESTESSKPGLRRWMFASVALVAALAGLVSSNVGGLRDRLLGQPSLREITSVAVLPLENLDDDSEQVGFADGMTDLLITELGKISGLRVISRQSMMQYKETDKTLPQIARELEVDSILEGTVARDGKRVRITAQLVQAEPEDHLWSQSYERELSGILALQGQVALEIAREIRIAVKPEEEMRLSGGRAVAPEAVEAYLKGRYYLEKQTEESLKRSLALFEQAIEKDPGFALAYTGLSSTYLMIDMIPGLSIPREGAYQRALEAAETALKIDANLAQAHSALTILKVFEEGRVDIEIADKGFRRAIELNPSLVGPHSWYSFCLSAVGRHREAIQEAMRARELAPLSLSAYNGVGNAFFFDRQYDRAIEQYQEALDLDPGFGMARVGLGMGYLRQGMFQEAVEQIKEGVTQIGGFEHWLGYAYGVAGMKEEAVQILEELKKRALSSSAPYYGVAVVYLGLGEKDQALDWLEKQNSDNWYIYLKVDPTFESLRDDPRFTNLLRRFNLQP